MRPIVYKEARTGAPASLLNGVEETVRQALGVRSSRHRSGLLTLMSRSERHSGAVAAVFNQIAANWRACREHSVGRPSAQNWRWRAPQLGISAHNASPEVVLERALVNAAERAGRSDRSNQVPVASGVAGGSAERRRAIDLVHQRGAGWFEFIELKVGSDTPLFAALEIIAYACIWLLSRQEPEAAANPLLAARRVDAVVLAPAGYYARYRLQAISEFLHQELQTLGHEHGVELTFGFEAFPDDLARPPFTDEGLHRLLDQRAAL